MDDFPEDTNPFETDVDDVVDTDIGNTIVNEFAEAPPSSPPPPEDLTPTRTEPPALPSKNTFPEVRPYNQINGYRSPIDLYLHSQNDVEIRVCSAILILLSPSLCTKDVPFRSRRLSKPRNTRTRLILPM